MGIFRIFNMGLVTAIRNKKRTIPMVILFTILFSLVTYQLVKVESYNTDSLILTRGVMITATGDVPASTAYDKISQLYNSVDNYVSAVFVVYYLEIVPGSLGIVSVRAYQGVSRGFDWRWVLDEAKPSRITIGRHIESPGEAIINDGYGVKTSGNGINVTQNVRSVGFNIVISRGERSKTLKVVGLYNSTKPGYNQLSGETKDLLVVGWKDFKEISENIWPNATGNVEKADYVEVRRVIFIAKGDLFSGTISSNLESIKNILSNELQGDPDFDIEQVQNIDPAAFRGDLTWSITTMILSLILAFIYAFIIVRFKGRDIATLRAIGWRKRDVLAFSFGEFFLIIITGYILGLTGLWLYRLMIGAFLYFTPYTYVVSMGLTLVSLIFGYLIVSRRVSGISPIKAFREA